MVVFADILSTTEVQRYTVLHRHVFSFYTKGMYLSLKQHVNKIKPLSIFSDESSGGRLAQIFMFTVSKQDIKSRLTFFRGPLIS